MKKTIMTIGPTAVPDRVIRAMDVNLLNHRSEAYRQIHREVVTNMQKVFHTKNDIYTIVGSATASMEASIANCFSAGDEIVATSIGVFSEQFAKQAEAYGLKVKRVTQPPGEATDLDAIMAAITPNTKGVLIIHNESGSGVMNDLEAFGKELKDRDLLYIVDSVSAAGAVPTMMDEWGIDILLTGSQKAMMCPPGLSFLALSEKAHEAAKTSTLPKYYLSLDLYSKFSKKSETPNTAATYHLLAAREALRMITDEGIDAVYARHEFCHQRLKKGIEDLGLRLYPKDPKTLSRTVNAVYAKGKASEIIKRLAYKNVIVNSGLGDLAEDIIRVGTMGYVYEHDVDVFLAALEQVLAEMK